MAKPPVLALAALPGRSRPPRRAVARITGGVDRGGCCRADLHDAPLPPWPGRSLDGSHRDWTANANGSSGTRPSTNLVTRNRQVAEAALGRGHPCSDGDLQMTHVFVDGDEITGVIDGPRRPVAMPCTTSPS